MAKAGFRIKDGHIRDREGRIRIFRGVNVSGRSKLPPFLPFEDPARLDPLAAWGMNAIRLLVIWEALEPERGRIDEAYLERIAALADAAGARGLHVIIDVHQDLFARRFGGDGAPDWAVLHPGPPARGRGWFFHYFRSAALRRSQAAFWANEDGIRHAFISTMRRLVARMSKVDAVIGFDLYNEPMSQLRDVLDGHFERHVLADFHGECARLVSSFDRERFLFAEPPPIVALGAPCRLPPPDVGGVVYAPHLYDSAAFATGRYLRSASTVPRSLVQAVEHAKAMRVPLFIGEFGGFDSIRGAADMIADQCRLLDRHFVSWTAWHYNPTDVDWNDENASIVAPDGSDRPWTRHLIRPYPRALAGEPKAWDSGREKWRLQYTATIPAATEIVVPARWRGTDLDLAIDNAAHEWNPDTGLLTVTAPPATEVTIHLAPRG